jgi:hypothetical protein
MTYFVIYSDRAIRTYTGMLEISDGDRLMEQRAKVVTLALNVKLTSMMPEQAARAAEEEA